MSTDVKSQLQRVKQLISNEQYEEARQILVTIDHPQAKKWLDQLNEKYPAKGSDEDRAKLNQAQAFIDNARYDEAIRILETMPHDPTAQKWLSRLHNLDRGDAKPMADQQFPAPPQVVPLLKTNLIDRLGQVGGMAALGAILFGIVAAIDGVLSIDSQIVYAILATVLTAVLFYGLALGLSVAFPTLQRNTLFAIVGLPTAVTLIATIIDSRGVMSLNNGETLILTMIFRLVIGFGLSYILSQSFQFVPPQGEPRLSRNMMILTGIALAALMAAHSHLFTVFASEYSGLGLGGLLGGLIAGLLSGAALGAVFAISLQESETKA